MLTLALKSGALYLFWKKFKSEIKRAVISFVVIIFILALFADLSKVLLDGAIYFVVLKWIFIGAIIFYNFYYLKKLFRLDKEISSKKVMDKSISLCKKSSDSLLTIEEIRNKKSLKSRSDILLEKYSS